MYARNSVPMGSENESSGFDFLLYILLCGLKFLSSCFIIFGPNFLIIKNQIWLG